jgi:hypothetical protein
MVKLYEDIVTNLKNTKALSINLGSAFCLYAMKVYEITFEKDFKVNLLKTLEMTP